MSRKTRFVAVPTAAMADTRLSALDHRVLQAACSHDRMSLERGDGQGCYASPFTLAREVNAHASNVSASIQWLKELGYFEHEQNPEDRRSSIVRVRYDASANGEGITSAKRKVNQQSASPKTRDASPAAGGMLRPSQGQAADKTDDLCPQVDTKYNNSAARKEHAAEADAAAGRSAPQVGAPSQSNLVAFPGGKTAEPRAPTNRMHQLWEDLRKHERAVDRARQKGRALPAEKIADALAIAREALALHADSPGSDNYKRADRIVRKLAEIERRKLVRNA